ncbi:MAG: general secretion pathway protein GspB [Gammaproteobacteria bacterium]
MSFILDALRKSENERQKSAVPGISDVPAVVESNRIPKWVLGVIATLSAVVLILGWAWWQSASDGNVASTTARTSGVIPRSVTAPPVEDDVRSLARESATTEPPPVVAPAPTPAPDTPAPTVAQTSPAPVDSSRIATAPNMMELVASGVSLPDLALELHVFSTTPAQRLVRINGASYREGDSLNDGPGVIAITPEGVVLDQRGQYFLLTAE